MSLIHIADFRCHNWTNHRFLEFYWRTLNATHTRWFLNALVCSLFFLHCITFDVVKGTAPVVLSVLRFIGQSTFCLLFSCFVNLFCLSDWKFAPPTHTDLHGLMLKVIKDKPTFFFFTVISSLKTFWKIFADIIYHVK